MGLFLALVHYPVLNKRGEVIASAVTNLDLHDIARASRTYGVERFYVVTPLEDQWILVHRIADHWKTGGGAAYNPDRRDALELIRLAASVDAAMADITETTGIRPTLVATTARANRATLGFSECRRLTRGDAPVLLCLGTAWGMAPEFMEKADHVLAPIAGTTGYNHLSVRCAAAIMLDRLSGSDERDHPGMDDEGTYE